MRPDSRILHRIPNINFHCTGAFTPNDRNIIYSRTLQPQFHNTAFAPFGQVVYFVYVVFFTVFMNVLCVCVCVQQARFAGILAQLVWFETHRVVRVVAGKSYQLGLN